MNKKHEEIVQEIIENFDFDRVHKVMEFLDWQWAGHDGVPSVGAIVLEAARLIRGCISENHRVYGSGGFMVYKNEETVELVFNLASMDAELEEGDE